MADPTPTGKFVWYEYMGDDGKAAVEFYSRVVGWSAEDAGIPGLTYAIVSAGSTRVGGVTEIPAEATGAKPSWIGYVWVGDVDKALLKLTAAGGKIYKPPSEFPGVGRFAVVADPDGAPFMLFRGAGDGLQPPSPPGTPGLVGWRELHAGDSARAFAFYSSLFGWKKERDFDMGPMGVYHIFDTGDGEQGGMFTNPQAPAPFWLYYFNVEAIDAGAARVTAHGGKIANGPTQVSNGQWIVQGIDPQGAMFALLAPRR